MKVVILGAGNVAAQITRALLDSTVHVAQIYNRTLDKAEALAKPYNLMFTDKISEIEKADLYIIATSDNAVEEVSYHIPFNDCLVVHTAGSLGIDALKGNYRKGVMYPLYNFVAEKGVRYEKIPFLLETELESDYEFLYKMLDKVTEKIYKVTAEQRLKMQLAVIFVSDFTNVLYAIAEDQCIEAGLPFSALVPSIEEMSTRIKDFSPIAQVDLHLNDETYSTQKHLEILKGKEKISHLYETFIEGINQRRETRANETKL